MERTHHDQSRALVPFLSEGSLATIKRGALLFDQIIPAFCTSIPRARRARFPLTIAFIPDEEERRRVSAELDWLYDRGLLQAPNEDPFPDGFEFDGYDRDRPLWIVRPPEGGYSATQVVSQDFSAREALEVPLFNAFGPIFMAESAQRISSPASLDTTVHSQLVTEVVLQQIPEPAVDTPWESIFEWRDDSDAQMKLRRLKHWINTTAQRTEITAASLRDEVLSLIDDYRQAMKVHDFNVQTGSLRTVVTTTAAVLENLAKFKFEKLADLPFQLLGRKIKRAEADLKAPGRDLAYIVATDERF